MGAWVAFWFPPVPLERVAVFRILVTTFALVDTAIASRYLLRYGEVDDVFFDPVHILAVPGWLGWGGVPVPPRPILSILFAALLVALGAALVGYRTRLALPTSAVLYGYFWAMFNSWGKVNHGKIPIIFALFVLSVAPAGLRFAVDTRRKTSGTPRITHDPVAGWALRVVGAVVVASYLLSVVAKLQNTGLSWPLEPVLAGQLRGSHLGLARWLAEQEILLVAMQSVTLVAEAMVLIVFFGGWRRNVVLAMLATFHVTSFVLLGTEFFGFIVCYAAFFRLEYASGFEFPERWRMPGRGADLTAR